MNRSCFTLAALLGLSLLSVDVARGQLLADGSESIDPQPKSFSTLLDMIGDCAHGAFDRCDSLGQIAAVNQTANDADTDGYVGDEAAGEAAYDTSTQDESADAATETQPSSAEEDVTQYDVAQYDGAPVEVARKTGDDYYLADEDLTSEAAVNLAFDRAIVPPAPSASTDDDDYSDCQDKAAAPANSSANEERDYENYENYDGEWNAESAPVPVAAAPVAEESDAEEAAADESIADGPVPAEAAAPADSADAYDADDADLVESRPAIDTHADGVTAIDSNRLDRRALLGVAGLLDRLGIALQNASRELTAIASKNTDSINR